MRTGIPRERGYAAFASLNSWLHAGLSFHPNGVVVHTQFVSAYDILTSGQRSGYRLTLWTILLYACTKSNPPSRHARTRRYLIGWCCYCRCCFCCCYRCCPLCHCCCCADTHRRQRAKGTRIGVVAGGGMLCTFLFPSWNAYVQTMGARCHVIPECTTCYINLCQSMIPDTRCSTSMPRAFQHQISAAAVL